MAMRRIRVYAETSVFGGVFDEEFEHASRTFFGQVRDGRFELFTSAIVQAELDPAPERVKNYFTDMLAMMHIEEVSVETIRLRDAYLGAEIVTPKASDDALHVALATVTECACIVSWNFRQIVHFTKIPLYNGVNLSQGYPELAIYSPREVIEYEDQGL